MSAKPDLYSQDYYAWTQVQITLLREGALQNLDRVNLIEEIEDLGRSARKELRSSLEELVVHLLKWRYQPDYQSRSWRDSIVEHRACVPESLEESPRCPFRQSFTSRGRPCACPKAGNHQGCPYTGTVEVFMKQTSSLRPHLPILLQECYPRARRKASRQTRLPLAAFPETCPWTVEQVLADDFWPGD